MKNKKQIFTTILTVLISVFLVTSAVFAVTTIGTDISTGGNLAVNGGNITTTAATFNLVNATATTVNLAGAATTLNIGAGGALARTFNIGTGTGVDTINIGTGATGVDVIAIGGGTGTLAIDTANWDVSPAGAFTGLTGLTVASGGASITGGLTVTAGGAAITGASTLAGSLTLSGTNNLLVAAGQGLDVSAAGILTLGDTTATTVNIGSTAATTLNIGAGGTLARTFNIGTGTGVDTINIGTGATGADVIAIGRGAGTLAIDTANWDVSPAGAFTGLTGLTVASGGASITGGLNLNAGSIINLGVTGASLTLSGVHALTLTTTGATTVTLPTSGTLYGTAIGSITSAALLGSLFDETGTGAAVFATSPILVTPVIGAATGTSLSLSGSLIVGSGTAITHIAVYTPHLTPGPTPVAIGTTQQTFMVTGLATTDRIIVNGPVPTSLCPMTGFRVSGVNTLQLDFTTLTAAACTPAAGIYHIVAIRN